MEIKKSPKADLERRRSLFLEIGLVIALGLVVVAFMYHTRDRGIEQIDMQAGPVETELTEITREDVTPPPPPERIEVPMLSTQIQLVTNNTTTDTDIKFEDFDEKTTIVFAKPKTETIVEEEIFVRVEQMPTFQGGDINSFRNWVQSRIKYPEDALEANITGTVVLQFVVEPNGELTKFEVLATPDASLSDEVIRVMKSTPKGAWKPGKQRGKTVRVKYSLPIRFNISQ